MFLRLNLYAHQRFPHNPVFVQNLLAAYQSPITRDSVAWEALIRQHWFEDAGLRNQFFEFLSRSGRLQSELNQIQASTPDASSWEKNPASAEFMAYANLWRSHFEESAPFLKSIAEQYPAEPEIAGTASSVYRSLAYFDSADTAVAARIQDNLLQANPADTRDAWLASATFMPTASSFPKRSHTGSESRKFRPDSPTDISKPPPSTGIISISKTRSAC